MLSKVERKLVNDAVGISGESQVRARTRPVKFDRWSTGYLGPVSVHDYFPSIRSPLRSLTNGGGEQYKKNRVSDIV